jgi:hypothetical protein
MTAERPSKRRRVIAALKLALAAAVVVFLFERGLIRIDDLAQAAENWFLLVLAGFAIMAGMVISAFRWGVLLRAQGIHLPASALVAITMTGYFFAIVAPGGLGGDAVKALFAARASSRKAEAATTVFLDRVIGLVTLLIVGATVIALNVRRLWTTEIRGIRVLGVEGGRALVLAVGAAVLLAISGSVIVTSKRIRRSRRLAALSRFIPLRGIVLRVYSALHLYGDRRDDVLRAVGLSLLSQLATYATYFLYVRAVGSSVSMWDCLLVVPPAMIVRALPLLPGGLGQGAAAFAALMPLVGSEKGGAVGTIGDAMFVLVYLLGGLFFVFGRTRAEVPSATAENPPPAAAPPS